MKLKSVNKFPFFVQQILFTLSNTKIISLSIASLIQNGIKSWEFFFFFSAVFYQLKNTARKTLLYHTKAFLFSRKLRYHTLLIKTFFCKYLVYDIERGYFSFISYKRFIYNVNRYITCLGKKKQKKNKQTYIIHFLMKPSLSRI